MIFVSKFFIHPATKKPTAAMRVVIRIAIAAVLFWGVPYYIQVKVQEYQPEAMPIEEAAPVVALSTKVDTLSEGQKRIESKVDAFSAQFLAYLERQAE